LNDRFNPEHMITGSDREGQERGITRRPCRPCGAAGLGGQQLFNGFPSIERFLARNHSTSAAHSVPAGSGPQFL
jgi:hypothetical protein